MRIKKIVVLIAISFISINSFAQTLKTVTIIQQRNYFLNGTARATIAGGKSKETIKIDLPENTKSWYYSFTTTPGSGSKELLDLGIQLTATMYAGLTGAKLASVIKVPKGSGAADVFVLKPNSRDTFLNEDEENWNYFKDISLQNTTQAVQYVAPSYGDSFYIGIENTSMLTGIEISIEVVAIVEVEETKAISDKGVLYGNLGWKSYEKGELSKSIELFEKALMYNSNLTYVRFNLALAHLAKKKSSCIDLYIEAISSCKNDPDPKKTLQKALQNIRNLKFEKPQLKNISEIEELISNELIKYQ